MIALPEVTLDVRVAHEEELEGTACSRGLVRKGAEGHGAGQKFTSIEVHGGEVKGEK